MSDLRKVLVDKLAKAQADGKVLNVSKLRTDGVGAVKAKRPATSGAEAKGKIKYIEGLDIISDNYGTYKAAADALGAPEFAREYKKLYGSGQASPISPKSPKKEKTVAKNFEERLLDAIEKAGNDKLVDVSNLHELKNGSLGGFRTVNRYDAKTGKDTYLDKYTGKKMWIEGLPMISNNYESYARAAYALDRPDLAREFARKHGENFDHRTKGVKSPAKSPKSPKLPGVKLTAAGELWKMYAKANRENLKLDVSGLDANKGTGSRISKTKNGITKVGVPELNVVSNNYPAFAAAMALLDEYHVDEEGGTAVFYEYAEEYNRLHGEGPGKRVLGASPKAKTPKRVRAPSIPRVGSASSASSASSAGRARNLSRSGSSGSMAERLARAASQERLARAASQERLARAASQERLARSTSASRSAGSRSTSASRSGSADMLPIPRGRMI